MKNPPASPPFPDEFAWGAATAAYQIEGAPEADGKGPSVWDEFCRWPGKIKRGETGATACDHYQRMEADVALMGDLGLRAYRFSVSWPRVLPSGRGAANAPGLAFYDRLVDRLLARGIQPWCTLFHWDYPLALQHSGGWLSPDAPRWFADYAALVAAKLGDRVRHWITLNEPQMFVGLGHQHGAHAPGLRLAPADLARVVHHVLLAHGLGTRAVRAQARLPAQIGWAPNVGVSAVAPEHENDPEVVAHARDGMFTVHDPADCLQGSPVWCDPVFLRRYPEPWLRAHAAHLPASWESDLATIAAPLDFCGLNIYSAWGRHTRSPEGRAVYVHESAYPPGFPRTAFGWPVTPEALYWGPRFFHERYRVPVVISENGLSCHDWPDPATGAVHDPQRIDFTARYLAQLRRALADGVDVRGYFHWSLMDNFEWAEGHGQRFGLVHVDFSTQRRTPKSSALWYRDLIATRGATLPADPRP